jgi:hypothetical protein
VIPLLVALPPGGHMGPQPISPLVYGLIDCLPISPFLLTVLGLFLK